MSGIRTGMNGWSMVVGALGFCWALAAEGVALGQPVDFVRDVQPIFAAHCTDCHGPQRQRNDYRLDNREVALTGGAFGGAIEPGDSAASRLIGYVSGADPQIRMPPDGPPLAESKIAILRAWIDQGAVWPDEASVEIDDGRDHWAYRPLVRPEVPPLDEAGRAWARTAIDAFILAKLNEKGTKPAPAADRRTLIRRVYFDLIGLPPSPQEVERFVADEDPKAYEMLVERLLASPGYGERWARHWMDVAQFAETHGHDEDAPRPNAWPYRDYLIESFNADKPYRRFIKEQVAGDVLYPHDPQGTVALGFLAGGAWDQSSQMGILDGTVDKKIAQVLDRDEMIATTIGTFNSMTISCARCHHHKFDPITLEDYYALQAVFAGVDRHDRPYDPDPQVHRLRRELQERRALLAGMSPADLLSSEIQEKVHRWEEQLTAEGPAWRFVEPAVVFTHENSAFQKLEDLSLLFTGPAPATETYRVSGAAAGAVTAVRLEVLPHESLPGNGPGRAPQAPGNLHLSEFEVYYAADAQQQPRRVAIRRAVASFNQSGWNIEHAIDGNRQTAWGIHPQEGQAHEAVFVLEEPTGAEGGGWWTFVLRQLHGGQHVIGRLRLSVTTASDPESALAPPQEVAGILAIPMQQRDETQRAELARHVLSEELERTEAALPEPQKVYAVVSDFEPKGNFHPARGPRPVEVLRRGDVLDPIGPAAPGTLSCIEGMKSRFDLPNPEDEGTRRAALAIWLADDRNVLTWRSIVNRIWHYRMGRGIVDTPNDFGRMGGRPSHPELLDWLAVEFREAGGSIKHLDRLIVTSAAYMQSSRHVEAYAAVDADNRYLWRGKRQRKDAEQVRDAVLVLSGLLDRTMGGPSARQFIQTPGVHVTPNVDYDGFDVDDPANHRRAVYRFLFRTVPDPMMEALDCPTGSQPVPVRGDAVTPLQALAMMNSPFMVRQAQRVAERLEAEADDPAAQVRNLYRLAFQREPSEQELGKLVAYLGKYGLAATCRVVINMNEFMFVD